MLRPLIGLAIMLASLVLLGGAYGALGDELGSPDPPPDASLSERDLADHMARVGPADAARLAELWDHLDAAQQERLLDILDTLSTQQVEDLIDIFDDLDPDQQADLLDILEGLLEGGSLADLSIRERRDLEAMMADLDLGDADALGGLLAAMSGDDPDDFLREREPRPLTSTTAGGLSGRSQSDPVPGPDLGGSVVPDRRGTSGVTCYAIFEPYLACAKRWQVMDRIDADYVLSASVSEWRPVPTGPAGGDRYEATFPIQVSAGVVTPIFSVAPDQSVWSFRAQGPGTAELLRDGRDVYGVAATRSGTYQVSIVLRDATAYRDGIPAVHRADMPPAPAVNAQLVARLQPWLEANGYWERDDVGGALTQLQQLFLGFSGGQPLSRAEQPDFFRAVVDAQEGCCRHFATAYMAAAQVMGVEARAVYNEGHMFVEVHLPDGWVEVQLGGCSGYEVEGDRGRRAAASAEETNDGLVNEAPRPAPSGHSVPTSTDITEVAAMVDKGTPFTVAGTVTTDGRGLPGAAVRLYANQTKYAPGALIGSGITDASGTWRIDARFPKELPPGEYQLVAEHRGTRSDASYAPSWSDPPITVHSTSSIEPVVPAHLPAGQPVHVVARLVDDDGVGMPGERIVLDVDGGSYAATTDHGGRASFRLDPLPLGEQRLLFSFGGRPYLEPSAAAATVLVIDAAFVPDGDTPLRTAADAPWTLSGRVLSQGAPVAGATIQVTAPTGNSTATSDADGRIQVALRAGLGLQWIHVAGPTGPLGSVEVWGQEPGALRARSPQYAADGRPAIIVAWSGTSNVTGIPITTPTGTVWTDASGRAEIAVAAALALRWDETPTHPGGTLTIQPQQVVVETAIGTLHGDRLRVPANATGLLAPDPPVLRLADGDVVGAWQGDAMTFRVDADRLGDVLTIDTGFPGHTAAATFVVNDATPDVRWLFLAGVVAAGIVAWWFIRSGRLDAIRKRPVLVWTAQGRPAGVPLAAAPDQIWSLQVRAIDPRSGDEVPSRGAWRVGPHRGRLTAAGTITLPSLPQGEHHLAYHVRAPGVGRARGVQTLRVADWGEHLMFSFDALENEARARAGHDGLTPHMVADALRDRDAGLLRPAIRIYEAAAYGQRPVTQDEWEAFALACLPEDRGAV